MTMFGGFCSSNNAFNKNTFMWIWYVTIQTTYNFACDVSNLWGIKKSGNVKRRNVQRGKVANVSAIIEMVGSWSYLDG